jgi:catechol 2,3-dioxygenase-like lactoylglutathione lyase family enzyme
MNIKLDHSVLHVSDWQVSKTFYREVMGAEVIARGLGYFCRFGTQQLNLHGPGLNPQPLARVPVMPGNSDLCFVWDGPIEGAAQHLKTCGVPMELGPVARFGAQGEGTSVYFRDPDGSLLEFISYAGRA